MAVENPFQHIIEPLDPEDSKQQFYNLSKLGDPRYGNSSSMLNSHIKPVVNLIE